MTRCSKALLSGPAAARGRQMRGFAGDPVRLAAYLRPAQGNRSARQVARSRADYGLVAEPRRRCRKVVREDQRISRSEILDLRLTNGPAYAGPLFVMRLVAAAALRRTRPCPRGGRGGRTVRGSSRGAGASCPGCVGVSRYHAAVVDSGRQTSMIPGASAGLSAVNGVPNESLAVGFADHLSQIVDVVRQDIAEKLPGTHRV